MEDIDKKHDCLAYHIKLWADCYHTVGETKGGMVALEYKKFIITSQYHPDDIWTDIQTQTAIKRRFKLVEVTDWKLA